MKTLLTLLFLTCFTSVFAQKYSLEKVMELALTNNHNIKVLQNNVVIADNNADPGNAGMYPSVDLGASGNYSRNDTKLELLAQNGTAEIEQPGAQSFNGGVNVGVNWVVFDGGAMFYNLSRLKILVDLENVRTRASVEATIMQVISAYYEAASAKNNVSVSSQSISITRDRLNRARAKFDVGGSSSIDFLSAEVDLNSDSVALANSLAQLAKSKEQLNQLTGYQLVEGFDVDEKVEINVLLDFANLEKQALSNNAQYLNTEYSRLVAEKELKVARSAYLPSVALNGSYGYSQINNEVGNLLESQTFGLRDRKSTRLNSSH